MFKLKYFAHNKKRDDMKNKGFALIELLAVIVILAVIILMITPRLLEVIEKSRKNTFETTAYSLIRTTKQFHANSLMNDVSKQYDFLFEEGKVGETEDGDKLDLSGTLPTTGVIKLMPTGKIEINVCNESYCACKGQNTDVVYIFNRTEQQCMVEDDGSISDNPITTGQLAELEEKIEEIQNNFLDKTYPVGSIFTSITNTSPATLFGGDWEPYGQGRTLIGIGSATDSNGTARNFNTVEVEGGAYTHILSAAEMPSHNHALSSGTVSSAGAHTHSVTGTISSAGAHTHTTSGTAASAGAHNHTSATGSYKVGSGSGSTYTYFTNDGSTGPQSTGSVGAHTHSVSGSAASAGAHTHTFSSGSAASAGAHTHSLSGDTTSTGSGGAHNNIQLYITVYMWKRTN